MAYMSTADAATIRADLAAAFPVKDGWKLSVKKSSGSLGIDVSILASPVKLESWKFDRFSNDPAMPHTGQEAAARDMRETASGDVNQYWFKEHHPPETVAVLEKLIGITLKKHWDESDTQSDYFHCAFYASFGIGAWNKPCKMPA